MAVGTTDTFVSSCEEICSRALANVGAIGPGETAAGTMLADAKARLDALVKSIDADGQFLWRLTRLTTTTTASAATVTISALAVDIDKPIRFTKSGETTGKPLDPFTRDEYMAIPDRTIEAETPTNYYVEKTLSGGRATITLYLYPEPSDTGDTVEYAAFLRAKDFNTGATNPDFPSSWTNCLEWGLTSLLATPYKQPMFMKSYGDRFEREKERLIGADNEKQDLVMAPFGGWGGCY